MGMERPDEQMLELGEEEPVLHHHMRDPGWKQIEHGTAAGEQPRVQEQRPVPHDTLAGTGMDQDPTS